MTNLSEDYAWLTPLLSRPYALPQEAFRSLLKVGDPLSSNLAVDGSGTSVEAGFTVPAGKVYCIHRCISYIEDTGVQPTNFGGIAALSTGLTFEVLDDTDTVVYTPTDGEMIKNNADFTLLAASDVTRDDAGGAAADVVRIRWTLERDLGGFLILPPGYTARIVIDDNLTGLVLWRWMAVGRQYDTPDA